MNYGTLFSITITDQFSPPRLAVFAENVFLITLHKFGTILFLLDLDRTLFIPCLCKNATWQDFRKNYSNLMIVTHFLHFQVKFAHQDCFCLLDNIYWSTSELILSIKLHAKRFPILLKSWIGWKNQSVCKCITIKVRTVWNV